MTGKNIFGLIFSNAYDESVNELTGIRTMGSVPFASRYRLIDFTLSNMVNAGIEKYSAAKSNPPLKTSERPQRIVPNPTNLPKGRTSSGATRFR